MQFSFTHLFIYFMYFVRVKTLAKQFPGVRAILKTGKETFVYYFINHDKF